MTSITLNTAVEAAIQFDQHKKIIDAVPEFRAYLKAQHALKNIFTQLIKENIDKNNINIYQTINEYENKFGKKVGIKLRDWTDKMVENKTIILGDKNVKFDETFNQCIKDMNNKYDEVSKLTEYQTFWNSRKNYRKQCVDLLNSYNNDPKKVQEAIVEKCPDNLDDKTKKLPQYWGDKCNHEILSDEE